MKAGWEMKKLKEVCEKTSNIDWQGIQSFKYIDLSSVSRENLKITSTSTIDQKNAPSRAKKVVKEGDVIFATTRPTLKRVTIISNKYDNQICSTGFAVLRPKKEVIHERYIHYFIQSDDFMARMEAIQRGTSYPAVTDKDVKESRIPIPPLSEQQQIVALLDQAFAAIDQAKANLERNLHNAKELFQSKLNEIFSQQGEGWENRQIESLTEIVTKGSSPKWQGVNYVEKPGVLFVTSENVGDGKLILKKKKYVEDKFNEKDKKSILKKGDVLTNIVGASIGRTAVFDLNQVANINQAVCMMRCDKSKLNNHYLMHLLNSPFFKKILHDNEVDNARANLSLTFFRNLQIPIPSLEIQAKIVKEIFTLNERIESVQNAYQKKLDNIDDLKKSLLQQAFAGELTSEAMAT